jgi:hypothetical protein
MSTAVCSHILPYDDLEHGLRAEYLEAVVTIKPTPVAMRGDS